MLVKFLRGTALGGVGNDAAPGDTRDLPDQQARAYLVAGRAVQVSAQEGNKPTTSVQAKPSKKAK